MKKIKYLAIVIIFTGLLQSCLKDSPYLDVSNTQPVVEFPFGSNGTVTASLGTLSPLDSNNAFDTVIAINLSSPQVLNYDITVTVTLDSATITSYNAANPSNQLTMIPDSAFSGPKSLDIVIPAGYRIARFPIKVYPAKIDPSVSFVIPYTITKVVATHGGAANILISGNLGSILYAFIGNPIAKNYTHEWIRYNNAAGTGTPAYDVTGNDVFTPVTPTQVTAPSGTSGITYTINFTDSSGVLVDFSVSLSNQAGVQITSGPIFTKLDPVNGIYWINFTYTNSAGAPRNITDKFNL
jgi:hypothetical protein